MHYGVFTSELLEIAQTRLWALCFYGDAEKSLIGTRLYKGIDTDKCLIAICEYNKEINKTLYAYEQSDGQKFTNDFDGICKHIGSHFNYDISRLMKIDDVVLSQQIIEPTVTEAGIEACLKQWRMGIVYNEIDDGLLFQMVTNKIEYVFSIRTENRNIYCGASINIPYNNGMLGSGQYFRIRNFADNSQPFCSFACNIGNDITIPLIDKIVCESGKCTTTPQGLFWPIKRYNDDEIVLDGCEGDEYIYKRNEQKSEQFTINPLV